MTPAEVALVSEFLKAGIIGWLAYAQQKGATEEQLMQLHDSVRAAFDERDPAKIPEV